MPTVCVLCETPTGLRAIGAMILVGDVANPEGAVVCRRCAALPAAEQKRLRDAAMTRMVSAATEACLHRAGAVVARGR